LLIIIALYTISHYVNFDGYLDDSPQRPSVVTKSRIRQWPINAPAVKCKTAENVALLVNNLTPSSATITPAHETTTPTSFTPPLALALLLALLLFANKSAFMLQLFLCLLGPHCRTREILRPPRVRIRAAFAFRAEAGKVKQAKLSANMSLGAEGAQFTKSPVVVFTGRESGLFANVLIEAVIAIGTVSRPGEGLALGHTTQVVLVQVLALHSLLAQTLEEMFADERAVCSRWRHP
jgi:hypothetical protein